MSLDLRGIHVSAFAAPDSFRFRLRRQRRDRLRRVLLAEATRYWAMVAVAAGIVAAVCHWLVG